jgi:hypothetical protein
MKTRNLMIVKAISKGIIKKEAMEINKSRKRRILQNPSLR